MTINSDISGNIFAVSDGFQKIFEKAKQKAKSGKLVHFNFNDWPYLVVDMSISNDKKIKQIVSCRDKIGEIEILINKYFFFGKETRIVDFGIYENIISIAID